MDKRILEKPIGRRDFLKTTVAGAAALWAGPLLAGKANGVSAAPRTFKVKKITWSTCRTLTPADMIQMAQMTGPGYEYLLDKAKHVQDGEIRAIAIEGLQSPRPRIMERFSNDTAKERIRQSLVDAGYIKSDTTIEQVFPPYKGIHTAVQDYRVSPGSGWGSHHAYPGGLVAHVATDLQIALGVFDSYEQMYGYSLDRELLINAILLHDNQKPWVLQWCDDNACLPEINVAGTGNHHIMEIADVMYRGLEPKLVIAIACSHDHPGWASEEKNVVGWIKAAGIISGKDPVHYGLLASNGETLPLPRRSEGFLVHLGDHDFVLTAPVSKWLSQELQQLTQPVYHFSDEDLQGKPFNTLRDYLYSQMSDMHLYQIWVNDGEQALLNVITDIVVPE